MAVFPYADMPTVVEARFDGLSWTDLSSRLTNEPINTREGRSPGAQRSPVSSGSLVLDNDDADLTPLHPSSPYWPYLNQTGFAMRIRQRWFAASFATPVADSWGSDWTNSGTAADYDIAAGVGTHTHPSASVMHTSTTTLPVATADGMITTSVAATATGGSLTSRAAIGSDTSNYYEAILSFTTTNTVTLQIARRIGGTGSTIGSPTTVGTYAGGTHWSARIQRAAGNLLLAKAWVGDPDDEPDAWTITAEDEDDLTSFTKLLVSSRREGANSNANAVITFHYIQANHDIYQGEVSDWSPDIIPTTDGAGEELSVVRIQLAGIGQRLTRNPAALRSPLNYSMSGLAAGDFVPDEYLSLEDGESATHFSSAIAGGTSSLIQTGVSPAADSSMVGSLSLPTIAAGASQRIRLPLLTDTGRWHVVLFLKIPSQPVADSVFVQIPVLGGAAGRVEFAIAPGSPTVWQSRVYDTAGTLLESTSLLTPSSELTTPGDAYGNWFTVVLGLRDGGGGNFKDFGHIGFPFHPGGGGGGTNAGAPGRPTDVFVFGGEAGVAVGHVGLFTSTSYDPLTDSNANLDAITGYSSELPHERAARACREAETALTVVGESSVPMGPQQPGALFDVLGECEDAAQSVFGESGGGLGFTCLSARYNVPVSLTVDLSTYRTDAAAFRQVLAPKFNDQGFVTKATAQRVDGGEYTYDSGVTPEYVEDGVAYNVETDGELPDIARWRVHMGQRIAMRYTGTPLNLGENMTLAPGWMLATRQLGLGRIVRTNVPTKAGLVDIDEMVDGWSQTLKRRSWTVTYDGTPTALLTAARYDDSAARYSSRSTTTAEALDTTETGIDIVTTTGKPPWITGSGAPQFPHDIVIGGERIRITASTSTGTYTRTLTVQRSINGVVKSHNTGAAVALYQPAIWAY